MNLPSTTSIIEDLNSGSRKSHDMLVAALKKHNNEPFIQEDSMTKMMQELHLHVVKLDRKLSSLPLEIMKLPWLQQGEAYKEAYKSFMLDLVSVHTGVYLHECIKLIIKNFKPSLTDVTREDDDGIQAYLPNHQLLCNIACIVPKVVLDLENTLPNTFIHHNLDKPKQVIFVRNMLHTTSYLPGLRDLIIKLTLKLFIQHDTRLRELKKDEDVEEDVLQSKMWKEADTLDSLLCVFYEFINGVVFNKDGLLELMASKSLYEHLMNSFQDLLLTPSMTSHTQYILFYMCSLHESIEMDFLEVLWSKIASPSLEPLYRQLSALYIAGILSRAKYISLETIKKYLGRMRDWIESYTDNVNYTNKHTNEMLQRHSPFYFLCQAFFYVIVCRHKMILDDPNGHFFLMSLYPQKIAFSRMNPLYYCLTSLAESFCAVVRNNQIAFCDTVLERNRRLRVLQPPNNSPLLSYAPFDPYLLPKSHKYIEALYENYEETIFHPEKLPPRFREDMEYLDLEEHMSCSPRHSDLFNYHMLAASEHS